MRIGKFFALLLLPVMLALYGCSNSKNNEAISPSTPPVTIANLNILHGFDCDPPAPAEGDQCRVQERVALLTEHLIAAGCPDLVTLQEVINAEFAPHRARPGGGINTIADRSGTTRPGSCLWIHLPNGIRASSHCGYCRDRWGTPTEPLPGDTDRNQGPSWRAIQ